MGLEGASVTDDLMQILIANLVMAVWVRRLVDSGQPMTTEFFPSYTQMQLMSAQQSSFSLHFNS